jgi:hypothetical protein
MFKYQFEDLGVAGPMASVLHHEAAAAAAAAATPVGGGASPSIGSSSSSSSLLDGLPSSSDVERTTFRCTVYYPKQFHALRLQTCGGDSSFIESLCRCNKWGVTGGKSGSTFLKTTDERFILKFITRTELKMFLEAANKYFEYMARNVFHALPSLLVKILGVYQLSWKKHNYKSSGAGAAGAGGSGAAGEALSSQYVLVMPNLFYGRGDSIGKIFDLKGSARNRYVKRKNRDENRVLLDENLMECKQTHTHTDLWLSKHSVTATQRSIVRSIQRSH